MTGSVCTLELIGGPVVKSETTLLKGFKKSYKSKNTVVIGKDLLNRLILCAEENTTGGTLQRSNNAKSL